MKTSKRSPITALALASFIASVSACSNAGKGDGGSSNKTVVTTSEALGADVAKFSRIVISPKAQWQNLRGYVVADAVHTALQNLADLSKPGFQNMNEGVYDVILEGKILGADGKTSPAAIRISGVRVVNGVDTQIREVDLMPYIKLEGKVVMNGESSHAGIAVKIPGSSLKAVTASDGSFIIENVPVGFHKLEFSYSGYNSGFIQSKDYRADTALPAISLTRDSLRLEAGVHYLGSALTAGSNKKINLHLAAPGSMTSFRFGSSENLGDRPWTKLQSSFETELPVGNHPEIFVQYSLDERQLSPVFSTKIPLDN